MLSRQTLEVPVDICRTLDRSFETPMISVMSNIHRRIVPDIALSVPEPRMPLREGRLPEAGHGSVSRGGPHLRTTIELEVLRYCSLLSADLC